ncbi:hypothetical protein PATSB16_36920 [Pandoraea thiooxydans]|nr:hypothetical protein PATSB16_36920 [Pandoraea thiooxydans]
MHRARPFGVARRRHLRLECHPAFRARAWRRALDFRVHRASVNCPVGCCIHRDSPLMSELARHQKVSLGNDMAMLNLPIAGKSRCGQAVLRRIKRGKVRIHPREMLRSFSGFG